MGSVTPRYTPDEIARATFTLLPRGRIWSTQVASILWKLWRAAAEEFARVTGRGVDFINETNPARTFELVEEWERALGIPDDCRPLGALGTRRARIVEKLTETPIITRGHLIELAASAGFVIDVIENDRSTFLYAGSDAGRPLRTARLLGAVTITSTASGRRPLVAGDVAGSPLGFITTTEALECLLDSRIHAHVHVTYQYL